MRDRITFILLVATIALSIDGFQPVSAQLPALPQPTVFASVSNLAAYPAGFYPADKARVNVTVIGDRVTGPNVNARLDVVFLMDESGSMLQSDPGKVRRQTIRNLLQQFSPLYHRASVIAFSTQVQVLSPLTTDFASLSAAVQALPDPADGALTNMAGAMAESNALLGAPGANTRIAILLTDGYPTSPTIPGYDFAQDDQITTNLVPDAIAHDINYYVVHLLPPNATSDPLWALATALMRDVIPVKTGGAYYTAQTANDITPVITQIVETASHTLILKNISIKLKYRTSPSEYTVLTGDGDITSSPGVNVDASEAGLGVLRTTPIGVLDDSREMSLTSTVTAYQPIAPDDLSTVSVALPCFTPAAQVSYDLGDGNRRAVVVPQVTITWLHAPALLWRKRLDLNSQTLTIDVRNYLPAGETARDVRLYELLGKWFEPIIATMTPHPNYVLNYDAGNGAQPMFIWQLGDIPSLEMRSVSFQVRYMGPKNGQVATDFEKPPAVLSYLRADGTRKRLTTRDIVGDRKVNAAFLESPFDYRLPDLYISNAKWPQAMPSDLSALPPPVSHLVWNDSRVNGWMPPAQFAYQVTTESLHLHHPHRVWFRVSNVGVRSTDRPWHVRISYALQFRQGLDYFEPENWKVIQTIDHENALLRGASLVEYIELIPEDVFSGMEVSQMLEQGFVFIKVDTWYDKLETKVLNNAAVVRVPVVP